MNKKLACIIAYLILLVLSLADYAIFPGIELRFFPVSLLRKNREVKNPSQHSITAKIYLQRLLAVQKSNACFMLMREDCHCGKYISNGLITFCKV